MPATFRWLALALLGIVIAAGISVAAGSLAGRQIGLASEPITAGDALAPAARPQTGSPPRRHLHRGKRRSQKTPTTPTVPVTPPTRPPEETLTSPQAPVAPGGNSGGEGGEHGGGSAADD